MKAISPVVAKNDGLQTGLSAVLTLKSNNLDDALEVGHRSTNDDGTNLLF